MEREIKIEIIDEKIDLEKKWFYTIILAYFLIFAGGILIYHFNFFKESLMHSVGTVYIQCIMYISFPIFYFTRYNKKLFFKSLIFYIIVFFTTYFIREKKIHSYFSLFYLTSWIFIINTLQNFPKIKDELLISGQRIFQNILIGIGCAFFMVVHLFFSVGMVKELSFKMQPMDKFVYWFLYGLCLNSLGEELFFRGLLFKELMRFGGGFWLSSVSSSLLFAARYVSSPDAFSNPMIAFGLIFYTVSGGVISCFLLYKTKSLIPSVVLNLTFNTFANLITFANS